MSQFNIQSNINEQIERLEQKYLRTKTLFVSAILFIIMIPILTVLWLYDIMWIDILVYFLSFLLIISINLIFFFYKHQFNNMQLSMYITAVGLYIIMFSVILDIYTASIFTILFLAYAIIALYQDLKLSIFNSFLIFLSGISLVLFYPDIFDSTQTQAITPNTIYIMVFFIIFIALLLTSSIIILKRKRYSYQQVAEIKEQEQKQINLVFEMQSQYSEKPFNVDEYYEDLENFSKALSNSIGIENIFKERLEIIKKLNNQTTEELMTRYKNYSFSEIEELKQLELRMHNKISKLAFKSAQYKDVQIDKKELLFERAQETLNYKNDEKQVKIIAFTVFYALLRLDKIYAKGLTHNQIMHILMKNRFRYFIDEEILDIFINNQSKIKKIVNEFLSIGASL